MGKQLKITALKPLQKDNCRHYWIIEGPQGGISKGECKFCGIVKEFVNSGLWTKGDTSLEINTNTA